MFKIFWSDTVYFYIFHTPVFKSEIIDSISQQDNCSSYPEDFFAELSHPPHSHQELHVQHGHNAAERSGWFWGSDLKVPHKMRLPCTSLLLISRLMPWPSCRMLISVQHEVERNVLQKSEKGWPARTRVSQGRVRLALSWRGDGVEFAGLVHELTAVLGSETAPGNLHFCLTVYEHVYDARENQGSDPLGEEIVNI